MTEYKNIPTVAVALVPLVTPMGYFNGVLAIRRGLKDGYGEWALPGGYQSFGETWQEAAIREVREETGHSVEVEPRPWTVITVHNGHNLIFANCNPIPFNQHAEYEQAETLEIMAIRDSVELAFPAHTTVLKDYLYWAGVHWKR